jgi:glycosyltransferase involved in cell wall biosynthesis
VNLFCVNADQMAHVYHELGADFFAGKYNIGYWFWELERFPEAWMDRFQYLDEIWVGSRFVQNTLAHVAPIPVVIMGVGMDRIPSSELSRSHLGLPEDKFIFLFAFDMLSVVQRKNPYGVIEAYRRAFGPNFADTQLVIKVTKLDQYPAHAARLRQAVAEVDGLLIDRYLDRPALDGLFEACDAYVSLHRSEGFGMTLAEAMCMGKPVIATDYGGNTDFMTIANSYPVAYRLVTLEEDYPPYQKGQVWADPDLDHAAAQMRHVFEHENEAQQKGQRAAEDIRAWYGRGTMARKMIERLKRVL